MVTRFLSADSSPPVPENFISVWRIKNVRSNVSLSTPNSIFPGESEIGSSSPPLSRMTTSFLRPSFCIRSIRISFPFCVSSMAPDSMASPCHGRYFLRRFSSSGSFLEVVFVKPYSINRIKSVMVLFPYSFSCTSSLSPGFRFKVKFRNFPNEIISKLFITVIFLLRL